MSKIKDEFQEDWNKTAREITAMIFDVQSFISSTLTFKAPVGPDQNAELKIRAIEANGDTLWQFVKGPVAENMPRVAAMCALSELLRTVPVDEAHVMTADQDLHCRISKKGRVLLSRSRKDLKREAEKSRAHDREKDYPLTRFDSSKLLLVLGFSDAQGEIKPSMHAKYRQVNEFLRIIDTTLDELEIKPGDPLNLTDVGCGKAYLSFAAKAYVEATRSAVIRFTGIDWNETVVASCRRMTETMGWNDTVEFIAGDIAKYKPQTAPHLVLSLHACDTATDEAMAFGVENSARAILCAPCCQHELQSKMGSTGPNRAILRNGILKERLADILTDAFRAQILRAMGYRTQVVEFIEQGATARNILIRGVRASRSGATNALAEYLELRDAWKCTPFLAERLASRCPELLAEMHESPSLPERGRERSPAGV